MKKWTCNSERTYKNHKNLFEKIKSSSKKLYCKNQLLKGTWSVITEVIGKYKVVSYFPNKLIVDNEEIADTFITAEKLNNYLADIGPKLASKIPQTK